MKKQFFEKFPQETRRAHKKNLGRDDPNIEIKHISTKCLHRYDKH